MKPVSSLLLRVPRKCRHCGAYTADSLADTRVGFTCCEAAVRQQIAYRTEDLQRLRDQARRMVEDADARAATLSPDAADRVRDGARARVQRYYAPQADELKADIERYEQLLHGQSPPPRPYRDDP